MASKKFLELQDFSNEELANELKETMAQYRKMKFEHALKGLENPLTIREVRRDIARMKTEVGNRSLAALSAEQLANRTKIRNRRRK